MINLNKDFIFDILNFTNNFPSISNIDKLLNYILKKIRLFANADGGSIYIVDNNQLIFKVAQNETLSKKYGKENFKDLTKSFSIPINNKSIAGFSAKEKEIINIPNTQKIDKKYPFKFNDSFAKKHEYKTESMVSIPLLNREKDCIGVIQLINALDSENKIIPFEPEAIELIETISGLISMNLENSILHSRLIDSYVESLYKLGTASEFKDNETSNHIKRVGKYSELLAEKYGCSKDDVNLISLTAPMHDIGKIGISDTILLKPSRFTQNERIVMETHAIIGAEIFKDGKNNIDYFSQLISLTHHEKFNGSGYPLGLKELEIPLPGRIVALADVFDALISKRVYKKAWTFQQVVDFMNNESNKHFDPNLIKIFNENKNKFREIYNDLADNNVEDEFSKFREHSVKNIQINIRYPIYTRNYTMTLLKNNPITKNYSKIDFDTLL